MNISQVTFPCQDKQNKQTNKQMGPDVM